MDASSSVRIILASARDLIRLGLRRILGREPNIAIIGEATSASETLDLCRQMAPDILILDSIHALREAKLVVPAIVRECPRTRVILVMMAEEVRKLSEELRKEVAGYLFVDSTEEEIVGTVRHVLHVEDHSAEGQVS